MTILFLLTVTASKMMCLCKKINRIPINIIINNNTSKFLAAFHNYPPLYTPVLEESDGGFSLFVVDLNLSVKFNKFSKSDKRQLMSNKNRSRSICRPNSNVSVANRTTKAHIYYLFTNESSKIQGQRLRIFSESSKTFSKDANQLIKFVLHPDQFHTGIINQTACSYNNYFCTSAKSIWNFSQFKLDSLKKFQLPSTHREFSSKASNNDSKTGIQNSASLKDRTANSKIQLQSGPSLSDFLQHSYKSTSVVHDENDDASYFDTEMFNGNNRSGRLIIQNILVNEWGVGLF